MNMEYKEKQKGGLSAPDLCFFVCFKEKLNSRQRHFDVN